MSDFAPPSGPPPPKVPEGWKAVWNSQYSEWFFVNIYTKKSQWDKPTEPAYPAGEEAPSGPPPSAAPASAANPTGASEKSQLSSNNPYAGGGPTAHLDDDEKLARKLQEEEDSKARGQGTRGAASDFYNQAGQPQQGQYGDQYGGGQQYGGQQYGGYQQSASPYPQAQGQPQYQDQGVQDKGKKGGFLGKLLGKSGSSSSQPYPNQQQGYGQQPYGQPGYAPQGGYYQQQAPPGKRPGGGMGKGGALALGAGAGLLGGTLIGEELANAGDGGDWGGDDGFGDGGDYGGGDF